MALSEQQEQQLLSDIETLKSTIASKEAEIKGLQTLNDKRGTELGDIRKKQEALDLLKAELDKKAAALDEALKKVEELQKNFKGSQPDAGGKSKKADDMTADELEATFTPEQKKTVEAVYNNLPDNDPNAPADKMRVANDETVRKRFFAAALSEVPSIPASPWKKPNEAKTPDDNEAMRSLFKTEQKRSTFTPSGPSSGARVPDVSGGSGFFHVLRKDRERASA